MAKHSQKEMNDALNKIKAYFLQQGMLVVWGQVKSKIEEKLGISIVTDVGSLVQFLPGANPAQKLADAVSWLLLFFLYYANQLYNPRINPFDPNTRLDDYVQFLLYTWLTNDAKIGPAYQWDTTNLKALGATLK